MTAQTPPVNSPDVVDIIRTLDTDQAGHLFTPGALDHLHEPIVKAFCSQQWRSKHLYQEREAFLNAVSKHQHNTDAYCTLFNATCEAGATQAALHLIRATGRRDRPFVGKQPLITMGTVAQMMMICRDGVAPVIHFLSRAAVSCLPEEPIALFRALRKQYDPQCKYSGRWQEAIQNLVKSRSPDALGLTGNERDPSYWVGQMINARQPNHQELASAVVAGLITKQALSIEEIASLDLSMQQKVRVVKSLNIDPDHLDISKIVSSQTRETAPSFRL